MTHERARATDQEHPTVYESVLWIESLTRAAEILAIHTPALHDRGAPPILDLLERANAELRDLQARVSD